MSEQRTAADVSSPAVEPADEELENPIERLQLLAGDDDAIAAFLDDLDVDSPREREMLAEIARPSVLTRPGRFWADHKRVLVALESLRRHGHHGSRAASQLGPVKTVVRYLIELVARYIVIGYQKSVAKSMRDLYWMRELEAPEDSDEFKMLRSARFDAAALMEIVHGREVGVPSFVIAGLLVPFGASIWRLASGYTFDSWWIALLVGLAGVTIGLGVSWVVLRGTALASSRIRLSVREPLRQLWTSIGHCGNPPKDQSRKFAIVSIVLTVGVWIVIPLLVTLSIAS